MLDRRSTQAGQILPFVGVAIAMLMAFAAMAVDVGYLRYQQRIQQTATDSAAIAAASEKYAGTSYLNAARRDATTNGFTDNGGTVQVTASSPPGTGNYTSDNSAVEVYITVQQPTFFSKTFGFGSTTVRTRAVATAQDVGNGPACLTTLSTTAGNNFNQDVINAPNCSLVLNGSANFTSASVTARKVECVSTCSNLTSPAPVRISPAADPCSTMAGCAYLTNNPPMATGCTSYSAPNNSTPTLTPGCYSSMDLHRATSVTFSCGLYVLTGLLNANTPSGLVSVNQVACPGNGVTFYLTGSGKIDMTGQNFNLSAPPSGSNYSQYSQGEQNVLFYQTPGDTNNVNIQQAVCKSASCVGNISGLLYFPTAQANYNKTSTNAAGVAGAILVFGNVNCNKCTMTLDGNAGGGGGSGLTAKRPVLVE